MKHVICPYCKQVMIDDDFSFRFRCQYCKEYFVNLDPQHCRPEVYWKGKKS